MARVKVFSRPDSVQPWGVKAPSVSAYSPLHFVSLLVHHRFSERHVVSFQKSMVIFLHPSTFPILNRRCNFNFCKIWLVLANVYSNLKRKYRRLQWDWKRKGWRNSTIQKFMLRSLKSPIFFENKKVRILYGFKRFWFTEHSKNWIR